MILLVLALTSFACAKAITPKGTDLFSGTGTEGRKQHGTLESAIAAICPNCPCRIKS